MRLSDDIKIRSAQSKDAVEIARIHVEAWRDAYAALLPPEYLARLDPRIEAARWNRAANTRLENTLGSLHETVERVRARLESSTRGRSR